MNSRAWGALLLLSALWGGSYIFLRVASPVLGPVFLIWARVLIAAIALIIYVALIGKAPELWASLKQNGRHFLIIGFISSALPFTLIATATLHLTASLAATVNATTPLFTALIAAIWFGEALTPKKIAGLVLGFLGVVVLVGWGPLPITPQLLLSVGAALLAALSYGLAPNYTRAKVKDVLPLAGATFSQIFASVLLTPLVPFAWPTQVPSGLVIGNVLALALVSTAFAYLLYFYLVLNVGAVRASMVTFMVPAFGILWGSLLLGEPLSASTFIGFGMIVGSVLLISGSPVTRTMLART
jgi:drug/metabolite transporter (DMT)-like permease